MKERGKRWLDVILVLLFSLIILVILCEYVALPIPDWLSQQNVFFRSLIIFIISACLWEFIRKTGGIRLNDLNPKSYFRYPSIWLTSILFVLLFFIVDVFILRNNTPQKQLLTVLSSLFTFIAAGIVVTVCHSILKPNAESNVEVKNQNLKHDNIFNDPKKIIEWINTEIPISGEADDLFNHRYIAKKIREIFDRESNKNIGIIGGYGSGKSSIINLIISKKNKKEIFCKIEGWGFKENTAIEHILQLVIEELKLHFDCLSIANLPKQYHEAMNNSGNNLLPILGCFFQGTRNPISILEKIDSILKCVNRKLVIVLEDIDRNINDATFYNEIASFLNVTKKCDHISFIIAIGPRNDLDSILTKLCEHNEYIQRIDKKEIVSICDILTDYWHDCYPDDVEVQTREKIMSFLGFPKDENEAFALRVLQRDSPIDYVSRLLDTPRKLKTALREIDSQWHQLHGEIDFKSFFLTMVLRAAAREAYTFINDNIKTFRELCWKSSDSKNEVELGVKALLEDWKQVTENVSWHVESAYKIICVLFPVFRGNQHGNAINYLIGEKTVQGFMDNSLADYWKRINVGRVLPDKIGDQATLKAIDGWKIDQSKEIYVHDGTSLTLANAIFKVDGLDDRVERFGFRLEAKEIYKLASELFEKSLQKDASSANQELCPGFINLWRLALKIDYSEHNDWLVKEIEKAFDVSLYFSNDLYYYWRRQRDYDVDAKMPTPELRKQVIDIFRKKFEGNPEGLVRILDQCNPYGLYHLIHLHREGDLEKWEWLGDVLLNAAEANQKLLASNIACLISECENKHSSDPKIGTYTVSKISNEFLKEIFGENKKIVMELLSKEFDYPELSDNYKHAQTRSVIQNAREEARKWLKKEVNDKEQPRRPLA